MARNKETPRFYFRCVGQSLNSRLSNKYQNARIDAVDREGRWRDYSGGYDFTAPSDIYWKIYDFFNGLRTQDPIRIKHENGKFSILEIPNIQRDVRFSDENKQESYTSEEATSQLQEIVKRHEGFEHFRISFDMVEMSEELDE
jgi:hypothetical protein